ncbi:MAG: hypothetical protein MAG715_01385 [Methanonatronarchaeales archaeon]|nr:hypothetical protein [Methanonatronarchaeales archaeon]
MAAVNQSYRGVLDFHLDDFFEAVLTLKKPLAYSYDYLRRKHQLYRYRELMGLKQMSDEEKERVLEEFLDRLS